jgi:hypothetical protein
VGHLAARRSGRRRRRGLDGRNRHDPADALPTSADPCGGGTGHPVSPGTMARRPGRRWAVTAGCLTSQRRVRLRALAAFAA